MADFSGKCEENIIGKYPSPMDLLFIPPDPSIRPHRRQPSTKTHQPRHQIIKRKFSRISCNAACRILSNVKVRPTVSARKITVFFVGGRLTGFFFLRAGSRHTIPQWFQQKHQAVVDSLILHI